MRIARVVGRPRLVGRREASAADAAIPQLLSEVRGERVQHLQQACAARSAAAASALVKAFTKIIICEMAVLKLSASMSSVDFLDRRVDDLAAAPSSGSTSWTAALSDPFAGLILLHDEAPDAREEAEHALDAGHAPRLRLLERAHEHLVSRSESAPYSRDDVVGIDHVAAALRHLLAVLAQDHALVDQPLERLGRARRGRGRTAPCARSARRAGAAPRARRRRRTGRPACQLLRSLRRRSQKRSAFFGSR